MTAGLRVSDIDPLGERPHAIIRGWTGISVAGVGTILGSPIVGSPADGVVIYYDATSDTWKLATLSSLLGNTYLTRVSGEQARVVLNPASGAAATIDCSQGNIFDITLTAACTLTITNAPAATDSSGNNQAGQIAIILRQGGTGSYTVSWPGSVKWRSSTGTNTGSAPALYTAVGAEDVVLLSTADGGTTWGGTILAHDAVVTGFGTPAILYGTPAAGSAATAIRTDATLTPPTEAEVTFTNITTNNVSTAKHGYTPILPNDATKFLDGTGAWSTPAGSGGGLAFTVIGQETRTSDGSTVIWNLDNDFEANSVQAFNLTTGHALVVTEGTTPSVTIGAAGTAGDVLSFAYAASAI